MKKILKSGLLFIVTLSIATVFAKGITSYIRESRATAPIQVHVTGQDSKGITTRDLNMAFLRSLQAYITENAKRKDRERLVRQGWGPAKLQEELDQLSSQATYIETGKKLAVIRLRARAWNSVVIVGLVNGNLTRVVCTRPSAEMIGISDGECGEKINEVF